MADIDVNQIIAAAQAQSASSSASVEDLPIVPLWKVRPANAVAQRPGGAGSSAAADHSLPTSGAGSANAADRYITDHAQTAAPTESYSTMAAAEGHWMDMTPEERMGFAAEAEKAGMWKKSQGADALFQSWAKAVGWAGKYNSLHQDDKSKWMSPFEAVSKLAVSGLADDNQSHDGFSTQTTIQQFSTAQLTGQAKQILQQELGRNPTDSEMKSYVAAVNAAARANAQTVTTNGIKNPDGSTTSDQLVTGGFSQADAGDVIQGMAQDSQESKDYKAAAMYLPALQQAISAFTHL